MEELERVLEDLERVFHVHIQWKSVGRGSPSCGLSDRHTFHGCEFCRRVKAEKRRYRLCSENDDILLPRLAGIEKGAFVHTCHAGVCELVVPLFEGDRCTEVFLAGVFRRENGESDAEGGGYSGDEGGGVEESSGASVRLVRDSPRPAGLPAQGGADR